eukprot:6886526-Pyramimonas_sp.AAC.1
MASAEVEVASAKAETTASVDVEVASADVEVATADVESPANESSEVSGSDVSVAVILLGLVAFFSSSVLRNNNKGNKIDDDKVSTSNFVLIRLGLNVSRNINAETAACAFNGF